MATTVVTPGIDFRNVISDMIFERLREAIDKLQRTIGSRESVDELLRGYAAKKEKMIASKFQNHNVPAEKRMTLFYIALQIEFGCRKYAIQESNETGRMSEVSSCGNHYTSVYSNMIYWVADLLQDEHCELIRAILEGKVHACRIPQCNICEICPSILLEKRKEIAIRMQQKVETKTSSAYVCKKCKARSTTLTEIQTRSSDEAPTLAIRCVNCGHGWTQNC